MSSERPDIDHSNFLKRLWRSFTIAPLVPEDDRERKRTVLNTLVLHLHPPTVPMATIRYTHTWGLGGMGLVLFLLLASTGLLLMFTYEPAPGQAYGSILKLKGHFLFGKFVRNIHHWSANAFIVVALLHMLRVFFTGGHREPRQFNWILGLCLLLFVLFSNFTGYLLPWDQMAYWAITIMTSMLAYIPLAGNWLQEILRGGGEIGPATLVNFYTLHTTLLPILFVIFMPWHFWRVRKAGGVVLPKAEGGAGEDNPERVHTIPYLVVKEFAVALTLIAAIFLLSIFVNAPLQEMANPGMSPNPAKAPWYFLGFQELLMHFHPLFAVFVIPVLTGILMILLPYFRYGSDGIGTWFISKRGRRMAVISAAAAMIFTPGAVILDEYLIDLQKWLPGLPPEISNGLVPFVMLLAVVTGYYFYLKRKYESTKAEITQAVFIFLLTSFIVLTIIGVWFRGEGMKLVWPGG
ncbi:MAG: cytochrome b N-terminal domain-containing protein [bacterium]|nr:MAG: cytochrome b N-terminal domain-containing protein [bacterium]